MTAGPSTWPIDPNGVSYPPPPWRLQGTAFVSLWRVEASRLPAGWLARDVRPVIMMGRALLGTAFAVYEPTGVLAYNEAMAAIQVGYGWQLALSVPEIWVDHPASIAGARAMWSIPKQEAVFRVRRSVSPGAVSFEARATAGAERELAKLVFRNRIAIPGRWPLRMTIVQRSLRHEDHEDIRVTEALIRASVSFGAATWSFARGGPLDFLSGSIPLVNFRLSRMALRIGRS
ncbi:acetoacetate decarboxylase family protein [Methylobacterium sp. WSM2598]|uniref:acetoacetate decarboxylase family protein n=1 Tax=Methylobacterium sp. WSM2598 TaxID=398261 RepID=UPI001AEC0E96|nr:acetoacetate decarboxylase family protein [Methylobacterium sp. WSM2598]